MPEVLQGLGVLGRKENRERETLLETITKEAPVKCEFCEATSEDANLIKLCGGMVVCDSCIHMRENHSCRICKRIIYWHDERTGNLILS